MGFWGHRKIQETIKEAELLIESAKEICVYLSDSVSPKCENIRNIINSIESNTNERKNRLALALEANRDIENALSWWEESSKILCRQISDQNAYSVSFLEEKLNESKRLSLLTAEYDGFVNIQYSTRLTKTILQVQELIEQYGKKISSSRKEPKPVQPVEPRLVELKTAIQINRANVSKLFYIFFLLHHQM